MKQIQQNKRNKAFLGTIISSAIGIGGSLIGGFIDKNAERKKALYEQKMNEIGARGDANTALATSLNNNTTADGYIDDYNKKITLRCGGSVYKGRNTVMTKRK